jgi:hypothetical protein
MKVLCPSCERLGELVDLRVERGALVVRCPGCKAEQRQSLLPSPRSSSHPSHAAEDDGNDEGPTIILLTPSAEGGPLVVAPPGTSAPPTRPAEVARFDAPGVHKRLVIPPPPPLGAEGTSGPTPRRAVEAELVRLLNHLEAPALVPRAPPPPPASAALDPGVVRGSTIQIPPGHCPKCITPRSREALLCTACGLVFSNFRAEEHQPSAALESAWRGLEFRWDKAEEHEKFLQLAFNLDELARAGRLYRIRLAQAPEDVRAKVALESMVRMASTAATLAARTDPAELISRRRKVLLVSAMIFFFIPIAALLANLLLRAR